MASDESMKIVSSIQELDEYDDIDNQAHPHNLSRLSVCTSSMYTNDDDDDDDDDDRSGQVKNLVRMGKCRLFCITRRNLLACINL